MKKLLITLGSVTIVALGFIVLKLSTEDQRPTSKYIQTDTITNDVQTASPATGEETSETSRNQKINVIRPVSGEYANPAEVIALIDHFLAIDPALSNDLHAFIMDPASMPVSVYSNFSAMASGWEVREKISLSNSSGTGTNTVRNPAPVYLKHDKEDQAKAAFEINLKNRERNYPVIEPAEGMIPVQEAVTAAMKACPVEFDPDQKPKVNLIRDFYLVFLWAHRRPYTDGTYHAASITIDAYSGEVRTVQTREDLKEEQP